jgi:hypothetical protein
VLVLLSISPRFSRATFFFQSFSFSRPNVGKKRRWLCLVSIGTSSECLVIIKCFLATHWISALSRCSAFFSLPIFL